MDKIEWRATVTDRAALFEREALPNKWNCGGKLMIGCSVGLAKGCLRETLPTPA